MLPLHRPVSLLTPGPRSALPRPEPGAFPALPWEHRPGVRPARCPEALPQAFPEAAPEVFPEAPLPAAPTAVPYRAAALQAEAIVPADLPAGALLPEPEAREATLPVTTVPAAPLPAAPAGVLPEAAIHPGPVHPALTPADHILPAAPTLPVHHIHLPAVRTPAAAADKTHRT